jgi:hypothetical protein
MPIRPWEMDDLTEYEAEFLLGYLAQVKKELQGVKR